jgi:hypothetical protein
MRNVERHKVTPKTQESDPNLGRYQSVNLLSQSGQIRSDDESYSNYTNRQTTKKKNPVSKLSRSSSSKSSTRSGGRQSQCLHHWNLFSN